MLNLKLRIILFKIFINWISDCINRFIRIVHINHSCSRTSVEDNTAEMLTFSNSLELIDYFLKNYAQLVVLDIDLLGEETHKMIEVLRSIQKETKIVLILSEQYMSICSANLSMGVLSYQMKPVSVNAAVKLITSVLQTSLTHN